MKFIPKYQQGSGFISYTPFMPSMPTPTGMSGSGGESRVGLGSSGSEGSSILDDATFKELLTKGGLVNDVNALVGQLAKMESSSTLPYMQSSNRVSAIRMISKVNELRQNKDLWESAVKTAEKNGALNEVAIGSNREVFTKNKDGQVQTISLSNYVSHGKKEQLLTVAELMKERQYNPALTGQNGVFNVANNSVGLSQITTQVNSMIKAFGTIEEEKTGFYKKSDVPGFADRNQPTPDEIKAVKQFSKIANTPGEYFAVKTAVSSQRSDVGKAVKYIWDTLGEKAQNKLAAVAAMSGEDDPRKLIVDMVMQNTDHKETTEVTPKELPGNTSADKASNQKPLHEFQVLHRGLLPNPDVSYKFNSIGGTISTFLKGVVGSTGMIVYPDGKMPGMEIMTNIFENGGYKNFLRMDDASIAGNSVSQHQMDNLVYANEEMAQVYLPVGRYNQPDWEEAEKFKKVYEEYDKHKEWDAQTAMRYFKQYGYDVKINTDYKDGKIEKIILPNAKIKPFALIPVYTNENAPFLKDPDKDVKEGRLIKLNSDQEKEIKPKLEAAWTVQLPGGKKTKRIGLEGGWLTDYYKGLLIVPYADNFADKVNMMVGQGPKAPASMLVDSQRNTTYGSGQPQNIQADSSQLGIQ